MYNINVNFCIQNSKVVKEKKDFGDNIDYIILGYIKERISCVNEGSIYMKRSSCGLLRSKSEGWSRKTV